MNLSLFYKAGRLDRGLACRRLTSAAVFGWSVSPSWQCRPLIGLLPIRGYAWSARKRIGHGQRRWRFGRRLAGHTDVRCYRGIFGVRRKDWIRSRTAEGNRNIFVQRVDGSAWMWMFRSRWLRCGRLSRAVRNFSSIGSARVIRLHSRCFPSRVGYSARVPCDARFCIRLRHGTSLLEVRKRCWNRCSRLGNCTNG